MGTLFTTKSYGFRWQSSHRRIPSNRRVNEVVRIVDLMPTILELFHVDIPDELQGVSFARLFVEESNGEDPPAYSERTVAGRKWESLRKGKYKLLRAVTGETWLFDVESRPAETKDLSAEMPDKVAELEREMLDFGSFLAQSRVDDASEDIEVDEATLKRLRELGYIQ